MLTGQPKCLQFNSASWGCTKAGVASPLRVLSTQAAKSLHGVGPLCIIRSKASSCCLQSNLHLCLVPRCPLEEPRSMLVPTTSHFQSFCDLLLSLSSWSFLAQSLHHCLAQPHLHLSWILIISSGLKRPSYPTITMLIFGRGKLWRLRWRYYQLYVVSFAIFFLFYQLNVATQESFLEFL